jgi:hypothetical protein
MIVVLQIAVLALVDVLLSAFRAAAGRDGRIAKEPYYRTAIGRGAVAGACLVAANAAIAGVLVALAPEPRAAWEALVEAGSRAVAVFAIFATLTLIAILFWFAPQRELRIVPTLLVLGPLTLLRPLVIAGGLVYAALGARDWRVWTVAVVAGVSMLGIEWLLGRAYVDRWRRLV